MKSRITHFDGRPRTGHASGTRRAHNTRFNRRPFNLADRKRLYGAARVLCSSYVHYNIVNTISRTTLTFIYGDDNNGNDENYERGETSARGVGRYVACVIIIYLFQ